MDGHPRRALRNRRMQRFVILVVLLSSLTIFGLYRRHRWPYLGSFYTPQPSGIGTLPLAKLGDTSQDDDRNGNEQQLLAGQGANLSPTSIPEYPFAAQGKDATPAVNTQALVEGENITSTSTDVLGTPIPQQLTPGSLSLDPTRVALLLETRTSAIIPALLSHFISVLPTTWVFRFVGSQSSNALVSASASLRQYIRSGKLIITELPSKYSSSDAEGLSATFTDLSFYKEFLAPAEWLFIFQTDSIICSASTSSLDDWVDKGYTWLGAPWHMNISSGGNGGLSLRHLPPIIKLLQKEQRLANDLWEDRWLTDRLGDVPGTHMAGPEISRFFSVESVWTEKPFGYHLRASGSFEHLDQGIWGDELRKKLILEYCPEVKLVLDMDLSASVQAERLSENAAIEKGGELKNERKQTERLEKEVVTLV